ncbi:four-carbon acid sugar kinase family protein [Enterovirga sp.]|uniref:four-carbon acid sugar kinase family protein n=1 Tax=Enterovirga sp. TaxID=2026350 RepID=UPI0026385955|nr:four-carbon acid sugar kinase family protein [Enterovirga sp.]MDB5591249.1 hypothetical protein [Enterovirga sp.]
MTTPRALPAGPLVAFYGDDFTGSSASMEELAFAGIETVLFLSTPSPERLAAFRGYRGIGIAGVARSRSPDWMDQHLPAAFGLLRDLGAPIVHYKVCSTFDSAPHIGSIGRAAEIGARLFGGWIPMVVGEPSMGRFQSFGHLFAMAHGRGFRLDRHPVMARHPVTPIDEADLGLHLARQTDLPIGLIDFVAMKRGQADTRLAELLSAGDRVVSIDVLDPETQIEAGRILWERAGGQAFAIGSQGLESALVAYWRSVGLLPAAATPSRPARVETIAAVSGSVSPVTARQIAFADQNGFAAIRLPAERAVDPAAWDATVAEAVQASLAALARGASPLAFTAAGPDDPAVGRLRDAVATSGLSAELINDRIGEGLGRVLDAVLSTAKLPRAVISGGDTSSHAAAMLGIDALTAIAPMAPGSPLCRAHAASPDRDGLELVLKGGQVGTDDFFCVVRDGGRP